MASITCRDCQTVFPAPTTRGRPPVKCVECRGLVKPKVATLVTRNKPGRKSVRKAAAKKSTASARKTSQTPSKATNASTPTRTRKTAKRGAASATAPSRAIQDTVAPIKKGQIRSGFCNPRHSPEIHNLCGVSACVCECHKA